MWHKILNIRFKPFSKLLFQSLSGFFFIYHLTYYQYNQSFVLKNNSSLQTILLRLKYVIRPQFDCMVGINRLCVIIVTISGEIKVIIKNNFV